jgi:hypothetical protein
MEFLSAITKLEHMSFLETAAKITPELSDYVDGVAEDELSFSGEHPLAHSRANHVHLWKIEWLADYHAQIDLSIRQQAVEYIFERWRIRLKSFQPYQQSGYRLIRYEDSAPTVSVVAETSFGFPYGGEPNFVPTMAQVLKPYVGRSWKARFHPDAFFTLKDKNDVLTAVQEAQGSIGTRAAQKLGLTVGEFRKQIEWLEMGSQVNKIRKQFHRSPAQFIDMDDRPFRYKVFEQRFPARYS